MRQEKNRKKFSRRKFLVGSGQFVAAGSALPVYSASGAGNYFSLGVASGAPRPDGVILWTRLAPNPLNGGGMSNLPAQVRLRVTITVIPKRGYFSTLMCADTFKQLAFVLSYSPHPGA